MTVGELMSILEDFDEDMEVKIGMIQNYGSNFAMGISSVEEHRINAWYEDDNYNAVVITEGGQLGTVNYNDYEDEW